MNKTLIIEVQYYGLGDHLFHSHLPRIAKETGKFDKVFVSEKSLFRNKDNRNIVWELNPYIDGFVDEDGIKCDISILVDVVSNNMTNHSNITNLLDEIMLYYGLDDGKRWHDPEIYYKPKFIKEYNKNIFDPNFFTYVGEIKTRDLNYYFKNNNITFNGVMKLNSPKPLHKYKPEVNYISTETLDQFCDLIYSCNKIYCLTTGTATLAAALNKPATVFWGKYQIIGFHHSTQNTYIEIPLSPFSKLYNFVKFPYHFIRYRLLKIRK